MWNDNHSDWNLVVWGFLIHSFTLACSLCVSYSVGGLPLHGDDLLLLSHRQRLHRRPRLQSYRSGRRCCRPGRPTGQLLCHVRKKIGFSIQNDIMSPLHSVLANRFSYPSIFMQMLKFTLFRALSGLLVNVGVKVEIENLNSKFNSCSVLSITWLSSADGVAHMLLLSQHEQEIFKVLREMEILTPTIRWQVGKLHLLRKIMWYNWQLQNSFKWP